MKARYCLFVLKLLLNPNQSMNIIGNSFSAINTNGLHGVAIAVRQ